MTVSSQIAPSCQATPIEKMTQARALVRPASFVSDLWRAPLHDFPIRDEILYQFFPLSPDLDVLEVGPGSGFTAFRLARLVRRLTVVDVARQPVAEVGEQLRQLTNVRCVCANVSRPGLGTELGQEFDAAFALDVLEYVVDPKACLRNLAEVLRPGGELLLSFPNQPPPLGDGVTYFSHLVDLEDLLQQAGFRKWQIFAIRLRPYSEKVFRVLHEWPLGLCRRLRNESENGNTRPQTYEATWAFRHGPRLHRYRVLLHLFWGGLEQFMRLGGDLYRVEPVTDGILARQLVIRAWR